MPSLLETVRRLADLDENDVIVARQDWSPESDAALFRLTKDGRVPDEAKLQGLEYFLEVFVAREVLEGAGTGLTAEEQCRRLIYYAIYDA